MSSTQELEFGRLAVERRLVSPEQLRECYQIAQSAGRHLGQVLIERGVINSMQAQQLFEMARVSGVEGLDRAWGQALLQRGLVNQGTLAEVFQECQALRSQGQSIALGARLVQRGLLSPPAFAELQASLSGKVSQGGTSYPAGYGASAGVMGSGSQMLSSGSQMLGSGSQMLGSGSQVLGSGSQMLGSGARAFADPSGQGLGAATATASGQAQPGVEGAESKAFKENDPLLRRAQWMTRQDGQRALQFGRFEVLAELARGGMGIVYKGFDPQRSAWVAIKVIKTGEHASEKQIRRFQAETEAAGKLEHPNIVGIHEVGEIDGIHFYSMDLVEGGALDERLKRGERPDLRQSVDIVRQVAIAIEAAHKSRIIHRDLKPANILFDLNEAPHVTDFGLAKSVDRRSNIRRSGDVVGTPYYMPPEQARGNTDIDERCDVYALGVILYELLTGRPPFRGETAMEIYQKILEDEPELPSELNDEVPRSLEVITLKAIEKRRERRYQSAQAFADDLQRFLDGKPVLARPPGLREKLIDFSQANQKLVRILAIAFVAIIVLGTVGTVWTVRSNRHQHFIAARAEWSKFKERLEKELQAIRERCEQLRAQLEALETSRSSGPLKPELSALEARIGKLGELVNPKRSALRESRMSLAIICAEGRARSLLFDEGRVREPLKLEEFLKLAEKHGPAWGLSGEKPWSADDVGDFCAMVAAESVDPDQSGPEPGAYKVGPILVQAELGAICSSLAMMQAQCALDAGDDEPSLKLLDRALDFAPNGSVASQQHALAARVHRMKGRREEAMKRLDQALEANPKNSDARFERGLLLVAAQKLPEAEAEFSKVIAEALRPDAAHIERARLLLARGEAQAAIEDLQKALDIKGDSAEAYFERGRAKAALKNWLGARDDFLSAIDRGPELGEAREALVKLAFEQKSEREVEEALKQRIQDLPNGSSGSALDRRRVKAFLLTLSSLYEKLGKPAEASKHRSQAEAITPG